MADTDDIKLLDSEVAEGINGSDADRIAAQYAQDASILPPGTGKISGIEGIKGYWQAGIDAGLSNVSIDADTIDVLGDTAVTVGTLSGNMGDTPLTGKYIVVSEKTADGWRIKSDIWNFDA